MLMLATCCQRIRDLPRNKFKRVAVVIVIIARPCQHYPSDHQAVALIRTTPEISLTMHHWIQQLSYHSNQINFWLNPKTARLLPFKSREHSSRMLLIRLVRLTDPIHSLTPIPKIKTSPLIMKIVWIRVGRLWILIKVVTSTRTAASKILKIHSKILQTATPQLKHNNSYNNNRLQYILVHLCHKLNREKYQPGRDVRSAKV